jgi:galactokinase
MCLFYVLYVHVEMFVHLLTSTSLHRHAGWEQAGQLIFLDCRDIYNYTYLPCPENFKFVIALSGAQHVQLDGKYNALKKACFSAAEDLGVAMLRDVSYVKVHVRVYVVVCVCV